LFAVRIPPFSVAVIRSLRSFAAIGFFRFPVEVSRSDAPTQKSDFGVVFGNRDAASWWFNKLAPRDPKNIVCPGNAALMTSK
jgi:hypothetical protein